MVSGSDDKSIAFYSVGENSAKKKDVIKDVHKRAIYSVSWSHCGGFVATGGADNAISVYRVAIGAEKEDKEEKVEVEVEEKEPEEKVEEKH